MKKRILILGAANDQVPLIRMAKELGYYVIVCDYTNDNPGLPLVDKHYQISYMERDLVLEVAKNEQVDGVISNSEPAMPIVAYVAEQLGLQGNTEKSINLLADKTKFREFQERIGLFYPKHKIVSSEDDAISVIQSMKLPVLLKACECSATRGTFKITEFNESDIRKKYKESESFSWNRKVAIEEFVEMPSLTTYEGDIFVLNGEFLWDGLYYTHRSSYAPMIPMTYIGPVDNEDKNIPIIQDTLKKVFNEAGINHGQYNVELYFNCDNELFIIEVNTRQGGRSLPTFINGFCGVDLTKLLITTAVGDNTYFEELKSYTRKYRYLAHHLLFSHKTGEYEGYLVNKTIENRICKVGIYKEKGDIVNKAMNGTDIVGYIDFEFPNKEMRDLYCFNIEDHVSLIINKWYEQ